MSRLFKLPGKIKVCSVEYDVVYPYTFKEDPELLGTHCGQDLTIKVAGFQNNCERVPQQITETLLHETVHAIDFWYFGEVMSENEVFELSRGWFSLLSTNDLKMKDDDYIPSSLIVNGFNYTVLDDYKYNEISSGSSSVNFAAQTVMLSNCDGHAHPVFKKVNLMTMLSFIVCDGSILLNSVIDRIEMRVMGHAFYAVLKDNKFEEVINRAKQSAV